MISGELGWLLLWGTLVGLDLVSLGQIMIARPLVAGTIAGVILGDPVAGASVGVVLELFALDLLPVGAARYPDYGPAAVAAATVAAGSPGMLGLGLAAALGLAMAYLGQWSIHWLRRRNGNDIRRHWAAVEKGDASTIARLHLKAVVRDGFRSAVLTAVGVAVALLLRRYPPVALGGALLLSAAAIGAALGVGSLGALRLASSPHGRWSLAAGLIAGGAWVILR
ncbi:PTS system sorbose-specific EIIC component [bacterium HR33]|nr:PTS system sorbose-specific EIIC component [bacterium HR33]